MAEENGKLPSERLFYKDEDEAGLGRWTEADGNAIGEATQAALSTAAQTIGDTATAVGGAAKATAAVVGNVTMATAGIAMSVATTVATPVVNKWTQIKDSVRTHGEPKPTTAGLQIHKKNISGILKEMEVDENLRQEIMANVEGAMTVKELTRTLNILRVLKQHGLQGQAANEFFLGGHFKIDDGGRLFRELKALEGAEPRFSSHFKETRQEELGINAGRIIPELLFLNTIDANGKQCSHCQTEASPWRAVEGAGMANYRPTLQTLQNAEHIPDSIIYFVGKLHSQLRGDPICNRSNYGWSPYADNNPITSLSGPLPKVKAATPASTEALLDAPMPKSVATATATTTAAVEQTTEQARTIGMSQK